MHLNGTRATRNVSREINRRIKNITGRNMKSTHVQVRQLLTVRNEVREMADGHRASDAPLRRFFFVCYALVTKYSKKKKSTPYCNILASQICSFPLRCGHTRLRCHHEVQHGAALARRKRRQIAVYQSSKSLETRETKKCFFKCNIWCGEKKNRS